MHPEPHSIHCLPSTFVTDCQWDSWRIAKEKVRPKSLTNMTSNSGEKSAQVKPNCPGVKNKQTLKLRENNLAVKNSCVHSLQLAPKHPASVHSQAFKDEQIVWVPRKIGFRWGTSVQSLLPIRKCILACDKSVLKPPMKLGQAQPLKTQANKSPERRPSEIETPPQISGNKSASNFGVKSHKVGNLSEI